MQPRRLNGDAEPADLLLGFEPITERIAFPSGLPTLLENLIRPLPDLRVRTEADHIFLLPVWLAVERLAQVQHFTDLSWRIRLNKDFRTGLQRYLRDGRSFEYSFLSLQEGFSSGNYRKPGLRRSRRLKSCEPATKGQGAFVNLM